MRLSITISSVVPTALIAVGVLAGCSGMTPSGLTTEKYQYDDLTNDGDKYSSDKSKVTVELNDDIKEDLQDVDLQIEKFDLEAVDLGTGTCRVNADVTYRDGVNPQDFGKEGTYNEGQPTEEIASNSIFGYYSNDAKEIVDSLPENDAITEQKAFYITKDFEHASFIGDCGDDIANVSFSTLDTKHHAYVKLVESDVSVTEGDEPTLSFDSEVSNLRQTPGGKWSMT